ncbi:MAG TPA: GNAT family N-acetyltransferase [Thermodesulfobacteriota bacterium]|nr:GNAT family N-acetyltransferase [Thermodesulfobacteriota bacterium]
MNSIVFKLYNPFSQFGTVKEIWADLLNKCPHSYYLAWPWTELWLKSLPTDCKLFLAVGYSNESPVIAFFLGSRTTTRHRFLKFRQLALNQTLIPHFDSVYIEYNSMLIDPKIEISLESILEGIPLEWDEFLMTRCSSIYQPNIIMNGNLNKKYDVKTEQARSYYVDLEKIRRNNYDYLALLSQKRRSKIRRTIKEYEKIGEIRIRIAETVEEALEILDELIMLHQKRWTERGSRGVFSSEYIIDFNKDLVSKRFEYGEIQLIKISAGDHTLGCLYTIVYNQKVLGGQCGFDYIPGNLYSPGIVCHYYSILHNAYIGLSSYDFMDGEAQYKESLSTNYNEIRTTVIHKRNIKFRIENNLAKLLRMFRKENVTAGEKGQDDAGEEAARKT